jgi:hypothetical protein
VLDGSWWKTSVTWVVAAAAAGLVFVLLAAWWRLLRRGQDETEHVVRLAVDISAVASSIEDDLRQAGRDERFPHLGARCRECRGRAEQVLAQKYRLSRLSADERDIWLAQLHDDHRRIVDLRSETDSAWRPAIRAGRAASAPASSRPDSARCVRAGQAAVSTRGLRP